MIYRANYAADPVFRGQESLLSDMRRILTSKLDTKDRILQICAALRSAAKRNRLKIGAAMIVSAAIWIMCRLFWGFDREAETVIAQLVQEIDTAQDDQSVLRIIRRPDVVQLLNRLGSENKHVIQFNANLRNAKMAKFGAGSGMPAWFGSLVW